MRAAAGGDGEPGRRTGAAPGLLADAAPAGEAAAATPAGGGATAGPLSRQQTLEQAVVRAWPVPNGYGSLPREHAVDDLAWTLELAGRLAYGGDRYYELWRGYWAGRLGRLGYPDEAERLQGIEWDELVHAARRIRLAQHDQAHAKLTGRWPQPDLAEGLLPDNQHGHRIALAGLEHAHRADLLDDLHTRELAALMRARPEGGGTPTRHP